MRLLFFTDTHIRGTNPRSRIDDFYLTLKNKFEEISRLIELYQVDYVLHGGDWFDRPDISPSIVRDFAMIIKKFNKPIYTIAGNHDIYGHNPQTLTRTMLGLLEGIDLIRILDYQQPVILQKNGLKVQLYGNSYNYDIDGENALNYYIVKKDPEVDYCINMVHGMLLPERFIEGIRYTLIENIISTEADITLVGHYHTGFDIKKIGEKYFVNPGSLVRISSIKTELNRKPKIAIIDLNEGIKIWLRELESAQEGNEVLSREHLELAENRVLKFHQFFQHINNTADFRQIRIDINKIIEEIALVQGINDKIKLETIKKIEQAKGTLSKDEVDI